MAQQPPSGPPQGWQPPQQPYPTQPAWGQQPPQPPQRRKLSGCLTFGIIVVGILAVAGIIGALTGESPPETPATGGIDASPETTAAPATTVAPSKTKLPALARDGKFEFTVTSFRCSGTTCRVQVAVENIGDEAQTMFATNQILYDTQGRRFEADSGASSEQLFLAQLNPGLSAAGVIVWKVPAGFNPDRLELHDSAFSGGAEVRL
jgi:hypothetical protein